MKRSTKNRTEGRLHEVKGTLVEKAGKLTRNPALEAEGADERNAGKVQKVIGKIEDVFDK
jgi:uncharacterized protein YjbJ (UPF0337 family)